mmetsp:Transcript_43450/g.85737  ORF Transcript_43450/g.85737 Transcript_43450/m.85737 type:complete len:102 (+) Transcript_43450:234-539(+)
MGQWVIWYGNRKDMHTQSEEGKETGRTREGARKEEDEIDIGSACLLRIKTKNAKSQAEEVSFGPRPLSSSSVPFPPHVSFSYPRLVPTPVLFWTTTCTVTV